LPDWGELLLLAQELKRPTAGQLETTSRLWRKCRPTRVVFQPLPKMLCTYVAVRLRRTARLGGIAAASAGPQEGYRCHAYQDLGKFHRSSCGFRMSVAYRPAAGLLRVASNIRVRLAAERTPLGKNLLTTMQNARFSIRRQCESAHSRRLPNAHVACPRAGSVGYRGEQNKMKKSLVRSLTRRHQIESEF
jgi:hypothetical protein